MKIRFLAFLMLLFFNPVFGQDLKPELDTYAPVSPNAASLGKYGLFPVNYNLGTVNTGIPIYTINTGQQELPITLSYNTGGIKVNELASWVGLGWSLNSGGAIVRNTKGRPENISTASDIVNLENAIFNETNYNYLYKAWTGQKDTQPDEFVINAPGISGSFYFDNNNNGTVVFANHNQAKVSVVSNSEIEVIKTDGTILRFGTALDNHDATEISKIPANNFINAYDYISTWYLTEMISTNGDTVSFRYKAKTSWDYPISTSENVNVRNASGIKGSYPENLQVNNKYLERIEFNNGYVMFNSVLDRQDLEDEFRLDEIKVYSGEYNSSSAKLIGEYNFEYSYFTRVGGSYSDGYLAMQGGVFNSTRLKNSREKALKLNKVIVGIGGSGQEYSFEYNNTPLPLRGSNAQDFWGYANNNTGSLLPNTQGSYYEYDFANNSGGQLINYDIGSGNREADETKMKAASLEKITYPTGGYTVFEYDTYKNTYQTTEPTTIGKNASVVAYGTGCNSNYGPSNANTTFVVDGQKYVSGSGKLHIYFAPITAQGNGFTHVEHNNQVYSGPTNGSMAELSLTVDVDFPGGTNTLEAYQYGSGNFSAYGCPISSISASWEEVDGTVTVNHEDIYGGLRVKSIKNYDGTQTTPVTIKTFEYSGANILQPIGNNTFKRLFRDENGLNLSLSTNLHFNNNLGGRPIIEYGKISEFVESTTNSDHNGKTEYFYETIPSQRLLSVTPPQSFMYSGIPSGHVSFLVLSQIQNTDDFAFYRTDNWQYGFLQKKKEYKGLGTTAYPYILINQLENDYYDALSTSTIKSNYIFKDDNRSNVAYDLWNTFLLDPANGKYGMSHIFRYFVGETSIGRKALKQTINTNYDMNGNNPVVKTTNYFYDNLNHLQPTRTETTNSVGELLKVKTSYAHDLGNQTLINQNRIAEPIQIETFKKVGANPEKKLIEQKTLYNSFGSNYLPELIQTSKGTGSLENRIKYDDYYANGKVKEVSKTDGTHVIYVWGYNGQYPIAKIEHATFVGLASNIQTAINSAVSASDNDIDTTTENTLRTALDALRNLFPNAMVTSYTYDPLVGVTSMTDPKGYIMYYEYDSFNRLIRVKDSDGNILSENEYNYASQNNNN